MKNKRISLHDMLFIIHANPAPFIGEKSLNNLNYFISGYQASTVNALGSLETSDLLNELNDFFSDNLGYNSTFGWFKITMLTSSSDEDAYKTFFNLFFEYCKMKNIKIKDHPIRDWRDSDLNLCDKCLGKRFLYKKQQ